MRKKAQGLSITTIIVAVIALVVLVVLVAIFTGRIGLFTAGTESCINLGGKCAAGCLEEEKEITNTNCEDPDNRCCLKIPG